ncbi:MAG: hypothetical protein RBT74_13015 [Tenuifilaceae bacterium]|jgi:PDZ domain-containing secreted protein|nr:hypothetical protein [Tenuifilaceae bacterium]
MEEYKKSTEGQVMGIIGIVMGIISLIVAFIPCVGVVAFLPGGLAIIFSVVSIVQASRGNGAKSLGIVSLVVSSLAILLAAAWLMLFSGFSYVANEAIKNPKQFDQLEKGLRDAFKDIEDMEVNIEIQEKTTVRIDSLENKLRYLEGDTSKR